MKILDRSRTVLREELAGVRPRHLLVRLLVAPLPVLTASRLRANIIKLGGYRIGRGVAFGDMPRIFGNGRVARRLVIGDHCFFNVGVTFELGEAITIGRWVTFGPDVMLLTTHPRDRRRPDHRCADHVRAPIDIGDGVWIGARATVLPGVRIGHGAVVGASALVVADVEPNTVVAGVPARVVRRLDAPAVVTPPSQRAALAPTPRTATAVRRSDHRGLIPDRRFPHDLRSAPALARLPVERAPLTIGHHGTTRAPPTSTAEAPPRLSSRSIGVLAVLSLAAGCGGGPRPITFDSTVPTEPSTTTSDREHAPRRAHRRHSASSARSVGRRHRQPGRARHRSAAPCRWCRRTVRRPGRCGQERPLGRRAGRPVEAARSAALARP